MLKNLKSKINKSDFARNLLILISGISIAQLIPILLQPILRRMFSTEVFGAFAVYQTIVGILYILVTLRYESAVIIPKEDKAAANILSLALIFNVINSSVIFLIFYFFNDALTCIFKFPEKYSQWLYFVPLSIFLFSSYETINNWLIRKKYFKASSINKITRRSSEGISQTLFGYFHLPIGLFIGDIIGNLVNNISGYYQLIKSGFNYKNISKRRLWYAFKKFSDFPKYNLLPYFLSSASLMLPVIIISNKYSKDIVGQFDLSRQVLALPLALISVAISQVLLQRLSEMRINGLSIRKNIYQIILSLSALGMVEVLIILFLGPVLFGFVFGNDWNASGQFSQILVFGYVIKFIVIPVSVVFISLDRIKTGSLWQLFYFIGVCSFFFIPDLPVNTFLLLITIYDVFAYFFYLFIILRVVNKYELNLKTINVK